MAQKFSVLVGSMDGMKCCLAMLIGLQDTCRIALMSFPDSSTAAIVRRPIVTTSWRMVLMTTLPAILACGRQGKGKPSLGAIQVLNGTLPISSLVDYGTR